MGKNIINISYFLLLLSVLVISFGTYQQAHSPQFAKYEMHEMVTLASKHPGEDLGPGVGVGVVLASAWPFVAVMQSVLILIYYAGITFVRKIRTRLNHKIPIILSSLIFILICSFSAYSFIRSAFENFEWSFFVRGVGEVISALGLALGVIAILREMPNTRHDPSPSGRGSAS